MNFLQRMSMFLAEGTGTDGLDTVVSKAYAEFLRIVNIVLPVIIGIVLVFGLIYSIVLGINYAKAEDSNARDEAKKRLIGAVVGVLIAAVLMAIIWVVLTSGVFQNMFDTSEIPGAQTGAKIFSSITNLFR